MNHFSYDVMQKAKARDLQAEGMRSQAFYRSAAPKFSLRRSVPKLIVALLGALGILGWLVR